MNKKGLRINEEITAKNVRLVVEGNEAAIVSIEEALNIARDKSLDLVEISPNQDPPVVKVMNYSRYVFAQRKKSKEQKKKQKVTHLKGIRFHTSTAAHDYEHKVKQAKGFLERGDKVRFHIPIRGREIVHKDLGFELLNRVLEDLKDIILVEQPPSSERRMISMIVAPASGSKKKKVKTQESSEDQKTDQTEIE